MRFGDFSSTLIAVPPLRDQNSIMQIEGGALLLST
jgi:hypothetical protein